MITINLPEVRTDIGADDYNKIAQDVADTLRGKVSAALHDAILREILRQEVVAFRSRADMTVAEFIETLED